MSFLGKLFGGGKNDSEKQGQPTPHQAIQKLRDTVEMLNKKQEYYEKLIEEQIDVIKKNGTKNKKVSLQALKKKKRLEKQLENVDGTLTTLEFQIEALENANTNAEVMKNMGLAAKALKTAHNNMDIDKVEDLMDEVREQQQIAEEIVNVITDRTAFGQNLDEDELLKELEEMEQEELDKQLLDAGTLPDVPQAEPIGAVAASSSKAKDQEEDELEQLKQWAI